MEQAYLNNMEPTQLDEALALGQRLTELQQQKEEKQAELEELERKYIQIEQELLPDLLDGLGVRDITLQSGVRILLEEFPTGRLTAAKRPAALEWLRENNFEGIIKNTVNVRIDRGDDTKAQNLVDWLREKQLNYDQKEDVHASTLKAFIKEQADKEGFPEDLFSVYKVKRVKFK